MKRIFSILFIITLLSSFLAVAVPVSADEGTSTVTVSSIDPSSGWTTGGTDVTITGTGFDNTDSDPTVTIGGNPADNIVFVSSTTITATTPAGTAGNAAVEVANFEADSGTLSPGFTYVTPAPTITIVYPDNEEVNDRFGTDEDWGDCTIHGTAFFTDNQDIRISDNNDPVQYWDGNAWSDNSDNWIPVSIDNVDTGYWSYAGINSLALEANVTYTVDARAEGNGPDASDSATFTFGLPDEPIVNIHRLHWHLNFVEQEAQTDSDNGYGHDETTPYLNGPSCISGYVGYHGLYEGEVQIQITVDGAALSDNNWITVTDDGQGSGEGWRGECWHYAIEYDNEDNPPPFPQDGSMDGHTYTISARAQDVYGTYSDVASRSFILDTTPPVIAFTGPSALDPSVVANPTDNVDIYRYITGTATDTNGAGISQWGAVYAFKESNETYQKHGESENLTSLQWLYDTFQCHRDGEGNYCDGDTYTLTIAVIDKAGNVGYYTSNPFVYRWLHADDFIRLYEGWNFISFPAGMAPDFATFGDILDAQGIPATMAYAYDASSESPWVSLEDDTPVNVLDGYWIKVDIYRTFNMYRDAGGRRVDHVEIGFAYADPANGGTTGLGMATKTLTGNAWNAVGVVSPYGVDFFFNQSESVSESALDEQFGQGDCPLAVTNQFKTIEGDWAFLIYWDACDQQYHSTIVAPGFCKHVKPGHGYWIFISKDTDDTYGAICNGVTDFGGPP